MTPLHCAATLAVKMAGDIGLDCTGLIVRSVSVSRNVETMGIADHSRVSTTYVARAFHSRLDMAGNIGSSRSSTSEMQGLSPDGREAVGSMVTTPAAPKTESSVC